MSSHLLSVFARTLDQSLLVIIIVIFFYWCSYCFSASSRNFSSAWMCESPSCLSLCWCSCSRLWSFVSCSWHIWLVSCCCFFMTCASISTLSSPWVGYWGSGSVRMCSSSLVSLSLSSFNFISLSSPTDSFHRTFSIVIPDLSEYIFLSCICTAFSFFNCWKQHSASEDYLSFIAVYGNQSVLQFPFCSRILFLSG